MKRLISILFFAVSSLFANEKMATISGFVFDETSGEALIGANIYLEKELIGSSSNSSGYYVITDVPASEVNLVASYLGYKTFTKKISVTGTKDVKLNIFLKPDVLEAEAIIVTADSVPMIEQMFEKEISQVSLSAAQINMIPQIAEADLLRSLQTLPGIVPLSDFSSALYIRGGTPDQNLYLLDGTDVYNPEHAFGLFSTFNTDAIKQVDLSKGGFGAEKGGRLSSIIDVTHLDGNREHFSAKTSISLLSARTTLQMPLGKIGSVSGSFRRTYFDQTVAKFIDDIPDYYFFDGNVKAFLDLDESNKLTISGYGGRDFLDIIFNNNANADLGFQYDWGNKTGSVKWMHLFGPKLFANFWFTASRFSSYLDFEGFDATEENILVDLTLKGNLEYHFSNKVHANFGFEQKNFDVQYLSLGPGREVRAKTQPRHYVTYLQSNWKPSPLWDIQAGVRFNYFDSDSNFIDFEPRFSLKYRFTQKDIFKFSTGTYYQYLHRIPRFLIADIWTTSNKGLNQSRSYHYIAGYKRDLGKNWQLEVEAFYKDYANIYSFNQNFLTELEADGFNSNDEPIFRSGNALLNRGDGYSRGFEVLLRRDSGVATGWLGYSLANTRYRVDGINSGRFFTPRHDRSHTINLVANIDLDNAIRLLRSKTTKKDSSSWSIGINYVYSTGQPITEPGSAYFMAESPDDPMLDVYFAPTQINQIRLPHYARLDFSITWQKQFKTWKIAPYLQIFNIGNRQNVWFATYDFEDGEPTLEEQNMFPILPTIGITMEF